MFKKLLSALTVMLFVFSMNAGAQELQKATFGKPMPKFAAKNVVTSKIDDLKGNEYWTGYWDGKVDDKLAMIGLNQTPGSYAAAICYPKGSKEVYNKTIEGFRFSFPSCKNVANVKVFISTKTPATADAADICSQAVTDLTDLNNTADPFVEVRFDKPYKVDNSKPVYIGYFFDVTKGSEESDLYPLLVYMSADQRNAMWLDLPGVQDWSDAAGNGFGILPVQILVNDPGMKDDDLLLSGIGDIVSTKNPTVQLEVQNTGKNGIESFTIETDVNGVKTTKDVKPSKKVQGFGTPYRFNMTINTPEATGLYDLTIKATKINGIDITEDVSVKSKATVVSKIVNHKVVVEEFTGLWCGFCPRGMVGLEKLRQQFGEDVVLIAAHGGQGGDPIKCKDYNSIMSRISGFPGALVDRIINCDPYFGSNSTYFGIKDDVEMCMELIPVAEIESKPVIDGDILKAGSDITFYYTGDASNYGVAYVLVEDGMSGTGSQWAQSNYYSGDKNIANIEPLFEVFTKGKGKVGGLTFNEVAIAAKGIDYGVNGSVPASVTEGNTFSHSAEFDLSRYKVIQDRDQLCVATLIIEKSTGRIVNADITPVNPEKSGIEEVEGAEKVIETARYTIDGRRINKPEAGVNIVKYSDGTVQKVIVK